MTERSDQVVDPGCRHAPVGQVGQQLRRVRRRRGARRARPTPGSSGPTSQYLAAGNTMRNGYPGYVAGFDVRAGARLAGHPARRAATRRARRARSRSKRGARADPRRAGRRRARRRRRHRAEGLLRPAPGRAPGGPRLAALPRARRHEPDVLRAVRAPAHGAVRRDDRRTSRRSRSRTAVTGSTNPYARYRKEFTIDEIAESPVVADPLRLVDICATSDGAAARRARERRVRGAPRRHGSPGSDRRDLDGHADVPEHLPRHARHRDRLGGRRDAAGALVPRLDRARRVRGSRASVPTTSTSPRSTTSRPRSSSTGTRTSGCARRVRPRPCCTRARRRSAGASR